MTEPRPRIAVVDDDLRMLESLTDLFEAGGYEAVAFSSARELLGAGLRHFDLIVADIGMPVLDGIQLRGIALRERPELPVFLITGRHELAERGQADGVAHVFRKPFDAHALLTAIGAALGSPDHGGRP